MLTLLFFLTIPHIRFENQHKAHDTLQGGTMIIAAHSTDGLVICSDKRRILNTKVSTDKDKKVTILNNKIGFFTAGWPIVLDTRTKHVIFSADEIATSSLRRQILPPNDSQLNQLAMTLQSKFHHYLLSKSPKVRPEPRIEEGEPIFFHLGIFFLGSNSRILVKDLSLYYDNPQNPTVKVKQEDISSDAFVSFGGAPILRAIADPKNTRYKAIRNDPTLKYFFNYFSSPPDLPTRHQTLILSRRLT